MISDKKKNVDSHRMRFVLIWIVVLRSLASKAVVSNDLFYTNFKKKNPYNAQLLLQIFVLHISSISLKIHTNIDN